MSKMPEGLLDDIKNYLDITWRDAEGDKKLSAIALSGIAYLNQAASNEFDYTVAGLPRSLLFDYVRYVRSNALEEFQNNYLKEIRALQIQRGLGVYDKKDG